MQRWKNDWYDVHKVKQKLLREFCWKNRHSRATLLGMPLQLVVNTTI